MARSTKIHCVCGTRVLSVNDLGLELRCECGETTLIPYEQLSGVEHLIQFIEGQAAGKSGPRSASRGSPRARTRAGQRQSRRRR